MEKKGLNSKASQSFTSHLRNTNKKIVIIGGGIGGLSAGIYARMAGYEVDIYEKNAVAGGQCMGWNRKGHHIDNCIHWLYGTKEGTSLRKLWEDIGALGPDTRYAPGDKFYTSFLGDRSATLWKDIERTRKEFLKLAPEDSAEIEKFLRHVAYASCCEIPADKPADMMGIRDYIRMGARMAGMSKVYKEYGSSNLRDLSERFRNPVLKKLFRDYMPEEYMAAAMIVSYAGIAFGNGEIPAGGSLAMVYRIIERLEALGGRLHCGIPVKRILLRQKKAVGIELENGDAAMADYVIAATDTKELFTKLIGSEYQDKTWERCYGDMEKYSVFSGFQAAYSIDRTAYCGTGTLVFDCEPLHVGAAQVSRIAVKSYEYEPGFAPAGKTVLQTNVMQLDRDYFYWKGLSREEYQEEKRLLSEALRKRIVDKFPELSGHIELLDCWTPLTYESYCNAYHGAYMGFMMKKGVKPFRVKGTVKGAASLFIASQWIMAPGGLPMAAAAGKFAVQRILKQEKRKPDLPVHGIACG